MTKPLLSVKQLCRMGHAVVFEEDCSYIINKETQDPPPNPPRPPPRMCNLLREDNGSFMLDVWAPPNPESSFVGQP